MAEVGQFIKEYSVRNKADEDIPVYSVTNDKGFCTGYFNKDVSSKDKTTYKIVPKGYFAYNPSRINVGSVDWQNCEDRVIVSPLYVVFSVDDSVDQQYFLHYLKSDVIQTYIRELATGSVRDNLKLSELGKFPINLIPLNEQKKVAANLDLIDSLISQRNLQLEKLDELVKSRFIEMFGDIKNNKFNYPVVNLGSCAKLQGGYAFKSADYVENGIKLVQIANVNKETLDWDCVNYVPKDYIEKYSGFALNVGDLVLAMTRPIIKSLNAVKVARVSDKDIPSLLNQRVGRFIMDTSKIQLNYLMVNCQMQDFKDYVESMSGNSLQPNISSKQVENYKIILPPLDLQNQFADFVAQVDKSKLAVQKSLEQLEILKKSLMQAYFG